MTTNYPTSIDSYTTHVDGDTIEPEYDNNQQDAIIALQTKLGVDNSAVTYTAGSSFTPTPMMHMMQIAGGNM